MTLSRRSFFSVLMLSIAVSFSTRAIAQTQEVIYTGQLPVYVGDLVDEDHATLQQVNAGPLCARLNAGIDLHGDHEQVSHANNCIFHIVRLKYDTNAATSTNPTTSTAVQAVDKENWYVYSNDSRNGFWSLEAFQKNQRLFGSDHFSLFYILINRSFKDDKDATKTKVLFPPTKAPPQDVPPTETSCSLPPIEARGADNYYPAYKVDVKRKVSANVEHLLGLLKAEGLKDTSAVGGARGGGSPTTGAAVKSFVEQSPGVPSNVRARTKMAFLPISAAPAAPVTCSPVANASVGSGGTKSTGSKGGTGSGPNCTREQILLAAKVPSTGDAATKAIGQVKCHMPDAVFGGGTIDVAYRPSDIQISASLTTDDNESRLSKADPYVIDNEGRYYFDFSVPLTLKKLSEVQYQNTSGTFSPVTVDASNAFMALDGFLRPVDVKSGNWQTWPHPLAGVAFAKQPLNKILLAGAWGPYFSEIYMGWVWIKQPRIAQGSNSCSASAGTSTTLPNSFGYHFCGQFSIGLNLSVTGIASKLGSPK